MGSQMAYVTRFLGWLFAPGTLSRFDHAVMLAVATGGLAGYGDPRRALQVVLGWLLGAAWVHEWRRLVSYALGRWSAPERVEARARRRLLRKLTTELDRRIAEVEEMRRERRRGRG